MAKFEHPTDDTVKLINDVLLTVVEERFAVNAKILVNNDQKEVGKVKKLSADVKFSYGDDLQIIVNEIILERLPAVEQNMYIQEMLAGVWFDAENDKLITDAPNVKTYSDFLSKFGYDKYEVMVESIKTLYDVKKEEDKQARDEAKASGNAE